MPSQVAPPSITLKKNRSLAIALLASAILLVAAGGIAWWIIAQKFSNSQAEQSLPNAQDTSDVQSVGWVAPTPWTNPGYRSRQENTAAMTRTVYWESAGCSVTATIGQLTRGKTVKDDVLDDIKSLESSGFKVTSSADGTGITLTDADGTHKYPFKAIELTQSVNVPGVSFSQQQQIVVYKQFNEQYASLSGLCKSDLWPTQKDYITTTMQEFTLKTERSS